METIMRLLALLSNERDKTVRILLIGIGIMWFINKIWRCYRENKALEAFRSNSEVKELEITKEGIKIKR